MRFEETTTVDAGPERVWPVVVDVERWPEITDSVSGVQRLDDGPLAVGTRTRVRQPRLRPAVWTVTAIDSGRSFVWETSTPGLAMVARHEVTPAAAGSTLTLTLEQTGALAGVLGRLYAKRARRYLAMEAAGMKARAEHSG